MINFKDKKIKVALAIALAVFVLLVVVIYFFFNFGGSIYGLQESSSAPDAYFDLDSSMVVSEKALPSRAVSSGADNYTNPEANRKIIRTGNISLRVKDIDQSITDIFEITNANGGLVESSSIYELQQTDSWRGSVRIRIPAESFENVFTTIKDIATKVEKEEMNTQDVTDRYVDIEATLRNMRAEEEQYLLIMNRTGEIEDVLKAAERLFAVRDRIERTEAQLLNLSRQVEMSTIYINLVSDSEVNILGVNWRPLFVFRKGLSDMLSGLNGTFETLVYILFRLPIVVIWLLIITIVVIIIWKIFKLLKSKKKNR